MLIRLSSVLIACAFAAGASAALAQTSPAAAPPTSAKSESGTIVAPVIVGGAAPPKVIQQQTWSFVQAYADAAPRLGLIGRWREPICVKVVNLTPEQGAMVQARVEQVARGVGLPVRKAGCESNIQIVLSSQPQTFVDTVAKNNEHALGYHLPSDLKKVKTVSHPIQAWYKTATQSAKLGMDGLDWAIQDSSGHYINTKEVAGFPFAPGGESVDTPNSPLPMGCAGSLISDCTRSIFKNVLVVVDSRAVAGKDLGVVADYVALLALSQVKPGDGCSPLPSILDLLAKSACPGRDPPAELTPADAAYLTALYASNPESTATTQRGDMAGRMAEMLIKANAEAKPRN